MLLYKSSKHLTFSICLCGVAGVWVLTLDYPLTQLSSILSTPIRTRQGTKYYKKGEQNMDRFRPDMIERQPEIMDCSDMMESIGEYPTALPAQGDWDSLADVPFAGDLDSQE